MLHKIFKFLLSLLYTEVETFQPMYGDNC